LTALVKPNLAHGGYLNHGKSSLLYQGHTRRVMKQGNNLEKKSLIREVLGRYPCL
jgi:hypothetical protein